MCWILKALKDEEGKGRMWPGRPRGLPTPLGLEPPLFDEQQLQRMRFREEGSHVDEEGG